MSSRDINKKLVQARFDKVWMKEAVDALARRRNLRTGDYVRRVLYAEMKKAGEDRVHDDWLLAEHREQAQNQVVLPTAADRNVVEPARLFTPAYLLSTKGRKDKNAASKREASQDPYDVMLEVVHVASDSLTVTALQPFEANGLRIAEPIAAETVASWIQAGTHLLLVGAGEWRPSFLLRCVTPGGAARPLLHLTRMS